MTGLLTALAGVFGIGEAYVKGRQEIKLREAQAESEVRIARMQNAASWETIVAQRSSRFLRWCCAAHLFAGLDFTIYLAVTKSPNPDVIFEAFGLLPEWYAGLLATMFAWAFASEPVKAAGGRLVDAWGKARPNKKSS